MSCRLILTEIVSILSAHLSVVVVYGIFHICFRAILQQEFPLWANYFLITISAVMTLLVHTTGVNSQQLKAQNLHVNTNMTMHVIKLVMFVNMKEK